MRFYKNIVVFEVKFSKEFRFFDKSPPRCPQAVEANCDKRKYTNYSKFYITWNLSKNHFF